jgi:3-(3-hydroxy-phenyl)propionate hydroxylase
MARCSSPCDSWEDLEGVFLPGLVPVGWVAVVRPDRTIVHDGPATDANRIVRESLALLRNSVSAPTLQAEYTIRTA